ncbi:MAG: hypothetical protein MUO84_02825 [Thermoplasmata archaeon]|nr:hypothetical protein [Thermoplasmata archaeon]
MVGSNSDDRSALIINVKRKAFQLGLEVGENNHLETVGWVRSELNAINIEARALGISLEVAQKYIEGKRLGVSRRSKHTVGQHGVAKAINTKIDLSARSERAQRAAASSGSGTFVERITPQEGLDCTISVMRFVAKNPEAKKDLNGLFAGIFDIQERLMDMPPGPNLRKTFEKCLQLLVEVGWIENCDVATFNEEMAVVTLQSTTAIAEAFGNSDEPMCQPICNLLETIGRKTFQMSVVVTEVECVAQGRPACKFKVSPRKAPNRLHHAAPLA